MMPARKKNHLRKRKKHLASFKNRQKPKEETTSDNGTVSKAAPGKSEKKVQLRNNFDDVKRIYSPFNRFAKNKRSTVPKTDIMTSSYPHNGLSPKEKSYVIASCQRRCKRYRNLKSLAEKAIESGKIFSIYGSCNPVRKALLERGWVEKMPAYKMNLLKIRNGKYSNKSEIQGELERILLSNMVEKYSPNFVWNSKDDFVDNTIDMCKDDRNMLINKLKIDAVWTTKQGLCSIMKMNYWFYIEDVADVNGPRTYNSYDVGETEEFIKDYKITACTSLLKWILSMVACNKPVFIESGKISLNVILFALNRCEEYILRKQNKDIDHPIPSPSSGQWDAFMKKYYRIISKSDFFLADNENILPRYIRHAKLLLKEMHRYRPQLSCEGCHNIWIIKPAHCSRGRGIRLASKLGVITSLLNTKYVIQKYIEEPVLIHDTKFDIRQYYLVTSTYPLVIWMYTDCYLKFSSQKYTLKNYHESIHLTNNAVQRKYANCLERNAELPLNNMWELEEYKAYLKRNGKCKVWDNIIYPGMKKSIIGIMLSCQDSLSRSKKRFELYGCDFILDKEYKPWLIEINSCPDLNHTTKVTAKICPAVLSDIIKVVIDNAENSHASTGKFECIFRQPITVPCYGVAADLCVIGSALPLDYFYSGSVHCKELLNDPVFLRELDLKELLTKIEGSYDTDIMVELDSDSEYSKVTKNENILIYNSESELEISVEGHGIAAQTEETTTCRNRTLKSFMSSLKAGNKSSKLIDFAKTVTDIKLLETRSLGGFLLPEQRLSFSKLDDDCKGSESDPELKAVENLFNSMAVRQKKIPITLETSCSNVSQANLTNATTRIISFIKHKQEEQNH